MDVTKDFVEKYYQFKHKPQEAIRFLKKKKSGECIAALYRKDIGDIDIVWGKVTDYERHRGYGLAHIIEKHEKDINRLGFSIEEFIPVIVQYGNLKQKKSDNNKIIIENKLFRCVIQKKWNGKNKVFLLTAFDLKKKPQE